MAFYSYLSTKIIIAFITKSYQDLFGVRSYINAKNYRSNIDLLHDIKEHNDNHRCIYKHLRCHFSVVLQSVSLCFPFYFF